MKKTDWNPVEINGRTIRFKIKKKCIQCKKPFFANHITREKCYGCTTVQCKAIKINKNRCNRVAKLGGLCILHYGFMLKKQQKGDKK